jgi:allantoicase
VTTNRPTHHPDLASRALGGAVLAANDEFFAAAANLNAPHPPGHRPLTFDERGQIYDGWETRRRRPAADTASPGDWAVLRLGAPGVIRRIVVDTAHFTGNFPEACTVEGTWAEGYPAPEELATWVVLLPRTPLRGDTEHTFEVTSGQRFTHVRLTIHPDGGVARLRVHGEPVPDSALVPLQPFDLAALANGASVLDCSNAFYSKAANLLLPDRAGVTGEGWETARRRDAGNDWVHVRLAAPGRISLVEVDTRPFIGNAPASFQLTSGDGALELLPPTRLQPQTVHRFALTRPSEVADVRLDIFPDGGLGRLRLYGAPTTKGLQAIARRWEETASGWRRGG